MSERSRLLRAEAALAKAAADIASLQAAVTAGAAAITALQASQATQDTAIAGKLDDSPRDGSKYVRKDGAWVVA